MRCAAVSLIKGKMGTRPIHDKPAEGSKLRVVYDQLMSRKGEVIKLSMVALRGGNGRAAADLRDYYGLDIRTVGKGEWVLAGEWFGRVYIDYIAEHLDPPRRAS